MALTALEIFKNLPKTNCKDCGVPTCLAFAMLLAAKAGDGSFKLVSIDKAVEPGTSVE